MATAPETSGEESVTSEVEFIVTAENQVYMDSIDEELSTAKIQGLIQKFSKEPVTELQQNQIKASIEAFRHELKMVVTKEGEIITGFIGLLAGQRVRDVLNKRA